MAKRKGYGTLGKAAGFLVAFLGIGFFATALDRFVGWNAERSGWKAGAVTLGATLLAYVGLKAMGQSGWAKTALVGGLAATGVQFLARPVNDAGAKLGAWLRNGLNGNGTPQMSGQPASPSSSSSPSSNASPGFTGIVPTGVSAQTSQMDRALGMTSTSPAQPQQQPQQQQQQAPAAVYHIAAPKPPSTLETITGAVAQLGSAFLGSAAFGSLVGGSKGSPQDQRWLASV